MSNRSGTILHTVCGLVVGITRKISRITLVAPPRKAYKDGVFNGMPYHRRQTKAGFCSRGECVELAFVVHLFADLWDDFPGRFVGGG